MPSKKKNEIKEMFTGYLRRLREKSPLRTSHQPTLAAGPAGLGPPGLRAAVPLPLPAAHSVAGVDAVDAVDTGDVGIRIDITEPEESTLPKSKTPSPSSVLYRPPLMDTATMDVSTNDDSQDLWRNAFENVKDEKKKKWLESHQLGSLDSSLCNKDILNLKKDIDKRLAQYEEGAIKIEIGKLKIVPREYILDAFNLVMMVGDVAMEVAPATAKAPWAIVKTMLKIAVVNEEQMCALAGTLKHVTSIVARCRLYESLYRFQTINETGVQRLENALIELYQNSMELVAESCMLLKQNKAIQIWKTIIHPTMSTDLLSALNESEKRVYQEVQACKSLYEAQRDDKVFEALERIKEESSALARVGNDIMSLLREVDKTQREDLWKWISPELFGTKHGDVCASRITETGQWLLDHEELQRWECIPSSSALFLLEGQAGTGKTYLTSKVIDHVKKSLDKPLNNEGFAYFYCSRLNNLPQKPLQILRSIVRQLSHRARTKEHVLEKLITHCDNAKDEGRELNLQDCQKLISLCFECYPKTTIILDALDESETETHNLAGILIDLMEMSKKPVKIFISSRPDRKFTGVFQKWPTIRIHVAKNQQKDIEKYLEGDLYSAEWYQDRTWSSTTRSLIKKTFESKSDGMFRWAYLQVKALKKCITDDAVEEWSQTLPEDLEKAYDKLLEDIKKRRSDDFALAERAIKWVMCAILPCRVEWLLDATQFALKDTGVVKQERRSRQEILSLCEDLLTIDQGSEVWEFPHASVIDYFQSRDDWDLKASDLHISRILLGILLNSGLRTDAPDENQIVTANSEDSLWSLYFLEMGEDKKKWDFHAYAMAYWPRHVGRYDRNFSGSDKAQPDMKLSADLVEFFGPPAEGSAYFRQWLIQMKQIKVAYKHDKWMEQLWFAGSNTTVLVVCCRSGFYHVLRDWWNRSTVTEEAALQKYEKRWKIGRNWRDKRDMRDQSRLLDLAVLANCKPICEYLTHLVDANHPHAEGHSKALITAISEGHEDIAKFLINEAKADIARQVAWRQWDNPWNAIQEAIRQHNTGFLQQLVERSGFDANMTLRGIAGSLLITGVHEQRHGSLRACEILVEAGADVNATVESGNYGTALVAAASHGDLKVVQWLIDHGAIVTLLPTVGSKGSALIAAAYSGNVEVIQLLIDHNADVNLLAKIGEYGSALIAAAYRGKVEAIQLLIDHNADVNLLAKIGGWGSALIVAAASYRVNIEVIQLLIDHNADVNLLANVGGLGSALIAAAYGGNVEAIQLLIDHNADVNLLAKVGEWGSALIAAAASYRGNVKAIQMLIDHDADVNLLAKIGEWGSALIAASYGGNVEAIRLLLDHNADVNLPAKAGLYSNALIAVAKPWNTEATQLLLDHGADVNLHAKIGIYCSPLIALAFFSNSWLRGTEVAKTLMEHNADPIQSFATGEFSSALVAAAFYGVTELLQEMVTVVGRDRAIEALSQSQHPSPENTEVEEEYVASDIKTYKAKRWDSVSKYLANELKASEDILVRTKKMFFL